MKREEINIRDPYVLVSGGKYYLYGTRSATTWCQADGFDVYVSQDLEDFEGPIEIFHRPEDFFATTNFWAPECYEKDGKFYFVTTFGDGTNWKKGSYVMVSDSPTGPFQMYSDRLNPRDWTCIDGTLWFEKGEPYLIYSHSFEDLLDPHCKAASAEGDYVVQKLSQDLKKAVSEPSVILKAKDCPWAVPVPFAKAEFGVDGDVFFSDGPNVVQMEDGKLYMINSSWSKAGYAVGIASSENGIMGPWTIQKEPLYPENGGHGMFFKDLQGNLIFTLHYPNDKFQEHPTFWHVKLEDGKMTLGQPL